MHEFRKEMNLQQAELVEMVGVRRETIGKLENGKYNPSLNIETDKRYVTDIEIKALSEIFNVTYDYLIDDK
jgi:putative transcriptional regulator